MSIALGQKGESTGKSMNFKTSILEMGSSFKTVNDIPFISKEVITCPEINLNTLILG